MKTLKLLLKKKINSDTSKVTKIYSNLQNILNEWIAHADRVFLILEKDENTLEELTTAKIFHRVMLLLNSCNMILKIISECMFTIFQNCQQALFKLNIIIMTDFDSKK